MACLDEVSMTHKIMQEGVELMRGDEHSVAVIFANLKGWNRVPEGYMAYMEQELGARIDPGKLEMASV